VTIDPADSLRHFRIGEFSRRVGVDVELLRAWERRYGVVTPSRTAGGLRIYGHDDERRVRRMQEHLRAGMSTAEAARLTRSESGGEDTGGRTSDAHSAAREDLSAAEPAEFWQALDRLDDGAANAVFDRLLGAFSVEGLIREAILPYLRELGDRWQHIGAASIAQEHFASNLMRGRLLGLARGWGSGYGPMALLACFPRDQHDLGLICFGLALRQCGWRITFLGADTPLATVEATARGLHPNLIVLTSATFQDEDEDATEPALARIGSVAPLALAGGGISPRLAEAVSATLLTDDPFTAAKRVTQAASDRSVGSARD